MKLLVVILTVLLVGCFATTTIQRNSAQEDLDKKIEELKAEQKKLEELEQQVKIKLNKEVEGVKIERVQRPHPAAAPLLSAPSAPPPPLVAGLPEPKPLKVESSGPKIVYREVLREIEPVKKVEIDRSTVVGQLYDANAVFAIPNNANIKEEIKAQLIIDPLKALEDLKKDATVGPVRAAEKIEISRIVIAKLDAPDFEIVSQTEPEQAIAETKSTEWLWTLRPKTSGMHPVNIVVYAEVTVGPKTTKHRIRTFDKQVMIDITATQMVQQWWIKYWQWLFATLLIPFAKWLYDKKYGKPKEKAT